MSQSEQGGAGRREVAWRLFAAEYDDADFSYSESDEERAPNYVVTPSGARINRLFVVGVLTETEQVNEDVLRARVVDPTGAFVIYAGQYQPDELAFLERADPPAFVAVTGKARTFQPEDSETVYTSVRPESINEVDAETRDRWVVQTAEQTLHRVATMVDALGREERGDDLRATLVAGGVDEGLAAGVAMALERYGTTPTYLDALRETALDAARVVAGERDEVDPFTAAPDEEGATTLGDLAALDSPVGDVDVAEADEAAAGSTASPDTATGAGTGAETATDVGSTARGAAEDESTTQAPGGDQPASDEDAAGQETTVVSDDAAAEPSVAESTDPSIETESQSAEPAGPSDAEPTATTTDEGVGETETEPADDIGDFDGGEFELEEGERERIEDEYGTDFSTGTEVEEPGEADIETPDSEDLEPDESVEPAAESAAGESEPAEPGSAGTAETEPAAESEPGPAAASGTGTSPESGVEPEPTDGESGAESEPVPEEPPTDDAPAAEDVDLSDAVMDAMQELDEGDGADRETVVERVTEEYGADPDEVEDAIQDALMDGRCYEPNETTLKPI